MNRVLVSLFLAMLFIPLAKADFMNSTNYTAHVVVDEGGGMANSTTYRLYFESGQYFSIAEGNSYRICLGHLCLKFGYPPGGAYVAGLPTVQFVLELSIGGTPNDVGYVDTQTASGTYKSTNINNYVGCIEDPVLTDDPLLGVVYAGSKLKYIKLETGTSYKITVSEESAGNRFVVPVTSGGCGLIASKYTGDVPIVPYVATPDMFNVIELILNYPVNLIGDFEKAGAFSITLQSNQANITANPV